MKRLVTGTLRAGRVGLHVIAAMVQCPDSKEAQWLHMPMRDTNLAGEGFVHEAR